MKVVHGPDTPEVVARERQLGGLDEKSWRRVNRFRSWLPLLLERAVWGPERKDMKHHISLIACILAAGCIEGVPLPAPTELGSSPEGCETSCYVGLGECLEEVDALASEESERNVAEGSAAFGCFDDFLECMPGRFEERGGLCEEPPGPPSQCDERFGRCILRHGGTYESGDDGAWYNASPEALDHCENQRELCFEASSERYPCDPSACEALVDECKANGALAGASDASIEEDCAELRAVCLHHAMPPAGAPTPAFCIE